jgi:succinoglycan biosynthesis protein ExoA
MTSISFIIPTHPNFHPEQTVNSILKLDYLQDQIEILIVKGSNPSYQRNEAALIAKGELLYFLDDDSYICESALSEALRHFNNPDVVAVGGPALTHDQASTLERSFGAAIGSWFGAAETRSRSRIIGEARFVRGEELILCNMLIRKDDFLRVGGFNVALYPNEENELLKRLRKINMKFYYDPSMVISRPRRKLISEFFKQMKSYGNGRAQHLFKLFALSDFIFLVPSLFVTYFFTTALLPEEIRFLPLSVYVILATIAAIRSALREQSVSVFFNLLFIFPLMHFAYGIGMISGLIKRKHKWNLIDDKIEISSVKAIL